MNFESLNNIPNLTVGNASINYGRVDIKYIVH